MGKAIIIGATSGIGKAIAIRLLEEGWTVGIAGRRFGALNDIACKYDNAIPRQMDVTSPDAECTPVPSADRLGDGHGAGGLQSNSEQKNV